MTPNQSHPLNAGGPIDPVWLRYLQRLEQSTQDTAQASDIAAIATALGSPDGTVESIPPQESQDFTISGEGPVKVTGSTESGHVSISGSLLNDSGEGALLAITRDDYGRISGTTDATITGTAGDIDVANGDAVAGPPTLSLADVPDAGGGTLQKTAFDAKGRRTGTSEATTSDLPEGANLYHTAARAADAAMTPYEVADGDVFTIPAGKQALFTLPIELLGTASLDVSGALAEVA